MQAADSASDRNKGSKIEIFNGVLWGAGRMRIFFFFFFFFFLRFHRQLDSVLCMLLVHGQSMVGEGVSALCTPYTMLISYQPLLLLAAGNWTIRHLANTDSIEIGFT